MRKMALISISLLSSSAHAASWSYEGYKNGQGQWAELSDDFALCANGSQQSPVSLSHTTQAKLPALTLEYTADITTFSRSRYSIVSTPRNALTLIEGSRQSTLKEMLVRSPSEHEIGDDFYPLELQFVHEDKDKHLTILSVFVVIGAPNPAMQTLVDHYPKSKEDTTTSLLEWQRLLPQARGYYAYQGSISYPPCTEGVDIRVFKTPIEASMEQVKALVAHFERNSRATQPVLMRTIQESEEE